MTKEINNKKVLSTPNVAIMIILGLLMFVPIAQAETNYDINVCGSSEITMVSQSKELTVLTMNFKGIIRSNDENKIFDNCSIHHVRVQRIEAGKITAYGYSKFLAPDEDSVMLEYSQVGKEATTKFLQGTGKWKGITGGGKAWGIALAKPITKGTIQGCNRQTGTFELPK